MPLLIVPNKELLLEASNLTDLFEKRQSQFMWLLVLKDRKPDLVLRDLHIEFNSNFYVVVPSVRGRRSMLEAYRVGKGYPLVIKKYCTWYASKQLVCGNETINMRRKDLMGYHMKVGIVEEWPDVDFFNKTHCRGHMCEVWEVLSQRLNVTYSFEGSDLFGGVSGNGSWEGLVGRLLGGHVDVGMALVMMTSARHSVVDFSLPLTFSRLVLFIQAPQEEDLKWDDFLRPFDRRLWLFAVVVIVLVWAVLRVQRRYSGGSGYRDDYNQTYSDVLHTAGIFFMQGCGEGRDTRSRDSVRATLLVASTSALVVYTAYCGALTASLATHRLTMPFVDLEGLLRDGSYKLLLLYASGEMSLFEDTRDPVLSSVYKKHVEKENMPVSNKEVFERICNSHKKAAVTTDAVYRAYKRFTKCALISTMEYISMQTAIAFTKNSPYRELINYHLLQLRNEGLTHRLYSKYWQERDGQETPDSLTPVSIYRVIPPLAVLAATALLSMCVLLLERKLQEKPIVRNAARSTD